MADFKEIAVRISEGITNRISNIVAARTALTLSGRCFQGVTEKKCYAIHETFVKNISWKISVGTDWGKTEENHEKFFFSEFLKKFLMKSIKEFLKEIFEELLQQPKESLLKKSLGDILT